jgi:hypothetical protein
MCGITDFKGLPLRFGGEAGVIAKAGGGIGDIEPGFAKRLATIPRFHGGKLLCPRLDEIGKTEKPRRPLGSWSSRPRAIIKSLAGCMDRLVHILCRRVCCFAENGIICRIVKRSDTSVPGRHKGAIQVVFQSHYILLGFQSAALMQAQTWIVQPSRPKLMNQTTPAPTKKSKAASKRPWTNCPAQKKKLQSRSDHIASRSLFNVHAKNIRPPDCFRK